MAFIQIIKTENLVETWYSALVSQSDYTGDRAMVDVEAVDVQGT